MSLPTPQTSRLDRWLGSLDRRVIYFGLVLLTLAPLVGHWTLPLFVTEPAKRLVETIDALPPDKLVLLSSDWDAGTQAESRPQVVALARHLIRRRLKFAILSIGYPTSPQLSDEAVREAIRLEGMDGKWNEGTDYVNLGFKIPEPAWLRSFASNIPQSLKEDWRGKPLSEIPLMQGVEHFGPDGQVSAVVDITGQATIDYWYQFLGPTKVKIALGCTAVMAPEQYPYLDSGQLSGLLTGMKGAAEYEQLIKAPGLGLPGMSGQSFAHLYILILIVLGNLSVVRGWGRGRRA